MSKHKYNILSLLAGILIGVFITVAGLAMAEKSGNEAGQSSLPIKEVERFTTAISQIKNFYVKPVNDAALFDNAIRGMVTSLDPHSDYLDPEAYKELTSSTEGHFSGIGLEVTMVKGLLTVVTPIDDTPAARVGIKPGDIIIKIDNTPIEQLTLNDAVTLMRGDKGSIVSLTVIRKGEKKPLVFNLVREEIHVKSVKVKLFDNQYGYIRINSFQSPTADEVSKGIKELQQQANGHLRGVILDLRNNPGGLLDSSIQISDDFLDSDHMKHNKLIVYTKGRVANADFKADATPGDMLNNVPMVVLINGGSASAAEIVAGALQDQHRAVIVGTKSFGKGSVQTVLPLDESTAIKLTTAMYFTPSGRSIQATGIVPDITIDDLKISKSDDGNGMDAILDSIKESNLTGHLQNAGNNANNNKQAEEFEKQDKALAYSDYQLYAALNILKGMAGVSPSTTATGGDTKVKANTEVVH